MVLFLPSARVQMVRLRRFRILCYHSNHVDFLENVPLAGVLAELYFLLYANLGHDLNTAKSCRISSALIG